MVQLQDLQLEDVSRIYKLTNYKRVMRWIGNGEVWSKEKVERLIREQIKDKTLKRREYFYYKIVEKEETIGLIGVHPFSNFPGVYLTVLIDPSSQGKGYYKKSMELLKIKLEGDGFSKGEVKILVRGDNKRMNTLCRKNYYFEGEVKFKRESFNRYILFFRKLTYLIRSNYLNSNFTNKLLLSNDKWRMYKRGKDKAVDFIYVDGDYYWDKNIFRLKSKLKNILVDNREKVTNKNNLYRYLGESGKVNKNLVTNYYVELRENKQKFKKYFNGEKLWLVKPVGGFSGEGIEIIDNYRDFLQYFKDLDKIDLRDKKKEDNFVLQEYITNPLLYKGKKFHIRCHFLVFEGEGWITSEMQCFTAKEKFSLQNFGDKNVHDTHFEGSESGVFFPSSFKLSKKIIEDLTSQIKKILREVLKLTDSSCWEESKRCYQIFGPDFMITDDYKVILLEVNSKIGLKGGQKINFPKTKQNYNLVLFKSSLSTVVSKVFPNTGLDFESKFVKI